VEKIITHVLCSITFFPYIMEKYGIARRTTDDRKIQRRKDARIETLIIFNNYCLSMATMFMQTLLSVTSHVHCLCCLDNRVVLSSVSKPLAGHI
jgi:hypothetical protein